MEDDLSLSEAQAILTSGNVVELLEANATDSSSVRLLWEVSERLGSAQHLLFLKQLLDIIVEH